VSEVRVEGVSKVYGTVRAVDDVTLCVPTGKLLSLLGPSGCGKSTVLRIVAGLTRPANGRVLIDGRDVTMLPANRRGIAMVFQDYALFPHMTVSENVAFGPRIRGLDQATVGERVASALAMVALEGFEARYPRELSGGQQQRVALARAIAVRPKVLLLDEPLSSLDAKLREQTRREIRALQRQLELTTIYVTHDLEEALVLSDVVALMREGRLEEENTPWQIYDRPRSLFGARFVGHANLFAGVYRGSDDTGTAVDIGDGVRIKSSEKPAGLADAAPVVALIRPERIELSRAAETTDSAAHSDNRLDGLVAEVLLLGGVCRVFVRAANKGPEVMVDMLATGRQGAVVAGERVTLRWRPDDVRLIAGPEGE
jgi:putative spermidine/putrescine transport system ATP-binding protein